MAMFDQADATNILKSVFGITTYTAVTGTHLRLGSTVPTATTDMTELADGGGYTTGGTVIGWTAGTAEVSNSGAVSWTNSGSSAWSIAGLEIWDIASSPLRHVWGAWTGEPISVAIGNTFQVAEAAITASLA